MPIHPSTHVIAPSRAASFARRGIAPLSTLLLATLAACDEPAISAQPADQTCTAPIQLAVGESADMPTDADGRVRCRIQASGEAEFAVSFVDTRATQKARTMNEGYGEAFSAYAVTADLADNVPVPVAAPAASASLSAGLAPDFDVQNALPPQAHATYRETPWTLNERFEIYDAGIQGVRTARVLRIYGGRYVYAWLEGENEPQLAAFMAQLDSAWAAVGTHALPLMRAAYSDQDPVTSPGSGQYLTVLRAFGRGSASGWTISIPEFGEPRIWTDLKVIPQESALRLGEIVAHELAHAFQALYMYRTRPAGTAAYAAAGAAYWGVEGGADLVAFEMVRRAAGLSLTGNLDMVASPGSPAVGRVSAWGRSHGGALTSGYADAAGFLRWQAALRVRAGDAPDVAVAEVLRGASDGWYGYDHVGARRTGLAERMRARLGAAWSPEDALLDWALAHAADDRTENARWQDPTYLRVWRGLGDGGSWRPASVPTAGGPASVTRPYGSPDHLMVRVQGSEPFAAASSVPGVRWRILRVR